ncbi:hypothetical protein FA10DRAFT_269703, partial [Acaromyces ingoldii]
MGPLFVCLPLLHPLFYPSSGASNPPTSHLPGNLFPSPSLLVLSQPQHFSRNECVVRTSIAANRTTCWAATHLVAGATV